MTSNVQRNRRLLSPDVEIYVLGPVHINALSKRSFFFNQKNESKAPRSHYTIVFAAFSPSTLKRSNSLQQSSAHQS